MTETVIISLQLLTTVLSGFLLLKVAIPRSCNDRVYSSLVYSLSVGSGFALTSLLSYSYLIVFDRLDTRYFLLEFVIILILWAACKSFGKSDNCVIHTIKVSTSDSTKYRIVVFAVLLLAAVLVFVMHSTIIPHGHWDALQTWNLFARFIYRGDTHWTNMFSDILSPHHPDYPLLIPLSVARGWMAIGTESVLVPIMIAAVFTFGTIAILVTSLALTTSMSNALLAGIILLGTPKFIFLGGIQYADIPIGFFFLTTFILLSFAKIFPLQSKRYLCAAGFFAGTACWTKNEGLLFLCAISILIVIFLVVVDGFTLIHSIYFIVGSFFPLSALLSKRHSYPFHSDLFIDVPIQDIINKFADIDRHAIIATSFATTLFNDYFIAAILLFYMYVKLRVKTIGTDIIFFVPFIMYFIGIYSVYIITPNDLYWQTRYSIDRIIMQIWPSIIYVLFYIGSNRYQAFSGGGD